MTDSQAILQQIIAITPRIAQAQIVNAVARMQAANHVGTLAEHLQAEFTDWYIPGYTGDVLASRVAVELHHLGFPGPNKYLHEQG